MVPTTSRIGEGEGREEPEGLRRERFSPALVVAARTVYRGVPVFDNSEIAPAKELKRIVTVAQQKGSMTAYPPVVVAWTEVPFLEMGSFSKKMFAIICAFIVFRLREELVINVP